MPLRISQATTSGNEYVFWGPGVLGTMVHPAESAVISEKGGFWEALPLVIKWPEGYVSQLFRSTPPSFTGTSV